MTCLGIPLGQTGLKKAGGVEGDNREITEDIRRLAMKLLVLSLGGRLTLINSILSTIPLHAISLYKIIVWM